MTEKAIRKLKAGRPGDTVFVRGTVREVGQNCVLVQFEGYALWINAKEIFDNSEERGCAQGG